MFFLDALLNSLLVVSSGYAMYALPPLVCPYGYTAAVFGMVHGLVGVIRAVGNDDDGCNRIKQMSSGIMEVIPLPLVNIELYLKSSNAHLAMAHGLFLIPMIYDLWARFNDNEDEATEALKDLMLLGNIVSMLFLAINENNNIYGAMAALAFIAKYASALLDSYYDGVGNKVLLLGNSGILTLMTICLRQ